MNARASIMPHVSSVSSTLAQRAHTIYWLSCDGRSDEFLSAKVEQDFERLADLLGYERPTKRKPLKPHQTNTEASRRALSADDLADIAYDERRDALEAAE